MAEGLVSQPGGPAARQGKFPGPFEDRRTTGVVAPATLSDLSDANGPVERTRSEGEGTDLACGLVPDPRSLDRATDARRAFKPFHEREVET